MTNISDVLYTDKDLGKNLYRKKTYYTLVVEQDVLAKNKDEADQKFLDYGGIKHSAINKDIVDASDGVETYMVDADYTETHPTKYLGKVVYEDDEFAKEDGLVEIDQYADEDALTEKDESDVDVAIQLEAENQRGK